MTQGEPRSEQEVTTLVPREPQTEAEDTASIFVSKRERRNRFLTLKELPEGEDLTHFPKGPWPGETQPLSLGTPILRGKRQQSEGDSLGGLSGKTHPSLEAPV